jgi:hypothetical protein
MMRPFDELYSLGLTPARVMLVSLPIGIRLVVLVHPLIVLSVTIPIGAFAVLFELVRSEIDTVIVRAPTWTHDAD